MDNQTSNKKRYTGDSLKSQGVSFKYKDNDIYIPPYIPSEGLVNAVNLALLLKRPLLLMGEPGCGKTRLAEAVAYELYGESYREHYEEWRIKSTTKAQDGLYRFDALRRLYDVQRPETPKTQLENTKLGEEDSYFQRGELSEAFNKSKKGNPCVLLIDEIDKADIDFPNDLLNELERYDFKITETGEPIPAPEEKPLIIITSNKEKELPNAFLRRCIYFFIKFPNAGELKKIVQANYEADKLEANKELTDKALFTFQHIREISKNADKKVSTSELLDWVRALIEYRQNEHYQQKIDEWLKDWEMADETNKEKLIAKIGKIPFGQTLIKDEFWWNKLQDMLI
jgi:MoxR-like ATPase